MERGGVETSSTYPVINPRCIQEYLEVEIEVIESKISELEQLGGKRASIIMSLYSLAQYGYSVHNMNYYQMCEGLHEIYWYRREEHKEYFELMDIIKEGDNEQNKY